MFALEEEEFRSEIPSSQIGKSRSEAALKPVRSKLAKNQLLVFFVSRSVKVLLCYLPSVKEITTVGGVNPVGVGAFDMPVAAADSAFIVTVPKPA